MAKRINKATKATTQKPIEQYEHKDKQRVNNPPVGLVDAHTDNGGYKKKTYQYDPHLDPQLQWAGKAEHTSFDVPTVSLHVHERIDPRRIIETVKKEEEAPTQMSLFEEQKKPLREAIEFYNHKENWSNRLIAGDSLLVMNSLLEKEGMGGKVQMVYFDPPYGIRYGSNFQPFVNKRDVKEKDDDLTTEPEMIKAFRDTWELGIHSYLTYLRDRLKLANDLLSETGSCFIQIGEDNLHYVRNIMDEVFGYKNFMSMITVRVKGMPFGAKHLENMYDHIVWYAKDISKVKYRQLFSAREITGEYSFVEEKNGNRRKLNDEEKENIKNVPKDARLFCRLDTYSSGYTPTCIYDVEFEGKIYKPETGKSWKTTKQGMELLIAKKRIMNLGSKLYFINYFDDYPVSLLTNHWNDTSGGFSEAKKYVVETNPKVIARCMTMCTDPGDLVFDPTCGSGTTAFVSENLGRRWMTCDTSRVALTLAKQRLMKANFNFYELAHPNEGVGSGFVYSRVPHITLGDLANDNPPGEEVLYDQPTVNNKKARVTGPFTFEAVPSPVAKSFEEIEADSNVEADISISRSGETLRQDEWRNELLRSGVRAKGGKLIEFTRVEPLSGTRFLQAEAETKEDNPKRVVVCFGPEHAPLEQRMVELALEEARTLKPKPEIILFCAFHFDSEARKDIEETNWPGITLLEAQMNADLLTDDLKKKRSSNESFWLIGQPDVQIKEIKSGDDKGKYIVEVNGFDYYNPKTGTVDSGGKGDIAMWMLDHDYDGRSLFPSQVFFPMAGAKEGWATLAKNLKAEIDEEKIEAFGGTVSLPFTAGKNVAVKIIDARGIESLKIIRL
ncbi:MAG: site-specific DNA-methyltransferase [Proteobacteria bacterium]|nr:site-specific DNA-methyltransferase [Pseudomonadota bacterium]MBS0647325.1 site-specific DNA-methyltransferase [Verrucomicrobiota bacterium]